MQKLVFPSGERCTTPVSVLAMRECVITERELGGGCDTSAEAGLVGGWEVGASAGGACCGEALLVARFARRAAVTGEVAGLELGEAYGLWV